MVEEYLNSIKFTKAYANKICSSSYFIRSDKVRCRNVKSFVDITVCICLDDQWLGLYDQRYVKLSKKSSLLPYLEVKKVGFWAVCTDKSRSRVTATQLSRGFFCAWSREQGLLPDPDFSNLLVPVLASATGYKTRLRLRICGYLYMFILAEGVLVRNLKHLVLPGF